MAVADIAVLMQLLTSPLSSAVVLLTSSMHYAASPKPICVLSLAVLALMLISIPMRLLKLVVKRSGQEDSITDVKATTAMHSSS